MATTRDATTSGTRRFRSSMRHLSLANLFLGPGGSAGGQPWVAFCCLQETCRRLRPNLHLKMQRFPAVRLPRQSILSKNYDDASKKLEFIDADEKPALRPRSRYFFWFTAISSI